jgi:hypothetical protein
VGMNNSPLAAIIEIAPFSKKKACITVLSLLTLKEKLLDGELLFSTRRRYIIFDHFIMSFIR